MSSVARNRGRWKRLQGNTRFSIPPRTHYLAGQRCLDSLHAITACVNWQATRLRTEVGLPAIPVERTTSAYQRVAALLRKGLDFGSSDSTYASHAIHPFAAKFPPQIPRLFIEELTEIGDSVLDSMAGSGTAIVEALLLRREAFGFDIDPLAVRLCRVKTTWLNPQEMERAGLEIIYGAQRLRNSEKPLRRELEARFDAETKKFLDYWFLSETQLELLSLALTIEKSAISRLRDFFELVFSSTIIAKTAGVSLARDLAHSRPHRDLEKNPRNAIEEFRLRLAEVIKKFQNLPQPVQRVFAMERSAKDLPLPKESVDLIMTSAPYAN
ncbi:MAG: DNA methyltransferase, partial [Terriglobia bacterium]